VIGRPKSILSTTPTLQYCYGSLELVVITRCFAAGEWVNGRKGNYAFRFMYFDPRFFLLPHKNRDRLLRMCAAYRELVDNKIHRLSSNDFQSLSILSLL